MAKSGEAGSLSVGELSAEQNDFAIRAAITSHAASIVASARGTSVEELVAGATKNLIHGPDGRFIEVLFPALPGQPFSAGGLHIAPTRGTIAADRATLHSGDADIASEAGEFKSYAFGEETILSGAELAAKVREIHPANDVHVEGISGIQQCLTAAGAVIGGTALLAAAVGCGTLCAGLIAGTITAWAAVYVCAGCVSVATGVSVGTLTHCFWNYA